MVCLHKADFFENLPEKKVHCFLCRRECIILDSKTGFCGVRKNIGGELFSLVYGRALSMQIDPIEKKPFYHFKPASQCLGISTFGCNFSCLHCQNYSQSQTRIETRILQVPFTSPEKIVKEAIDAGIEGIAYTYNEPTIFAEFALGTMKLAHEKGLYNAWVSNGYMGKECAKAILPFLDAINIDLKGGKKFYKEVCGNANVEFVKQNIEFFHSKGVHIEIAYLIIPGYNDSEEDFKEAAEFLSGIGKKIPLHFSRFFPTYKMGHLPETGISKLETARRIAEKAGLEFVFLGNVLGKEDSFCPKCKNILVKREGYSAEVQGLGKKGNCAKCGYKTGIAL
ncbi:MAG: AmmeMemoRadiSam system radical SAM enzyme [Candidatus ainarchaeum sp.]|nr:AmmeMemoRadiSam system radical SAM enzyme [Candidatus ainarchaeum sp.]